MNGGVKLPPTILLFRKPIARDWAFWVWLMLTVASSLAALGRTGSSGGFTTGAGGIASGILDAASHPVAAYLLTALILIPRKILWRVRTTPSSAENSQTEPARRRHEATSGRESDEHLRSRIRTELVEHKQFREDERKRIQDSEVRPARSLEDAHGLAGTYSVGTVENPSRSPRSPEKRALGLVAIALAIAIAIALVGPRLNFGDASIDANVDTNQKSDSISNSLTTQSIAPEVVTWSPPGFLEWSEDVAYRWLKDPEVSCTGPCMYWSLQVIAREECAEGVYAEFNVIRTGVVVDWTSDSVPFLGANQRAQLDFVLNGSFALEEYRGDLVTLECRQS